MRAENVDIRPAVPSDHPALDAIRRAAFAPVFASFRALLGDEIYALAQQPDDEAQGNLLSSLLAPDSGWEVYTVEWRGDVVGFVSVRLDRARRLGEIGLNAVHPDAAGRGIGAAMYDFALDRMRQEGLLVATVGTGGDPSHAPARRAYEKAGFDRAIPSLWMSRKV